MTTYALRVAGPDDDAATYEIHRAAMKEVVAATWGQWDDIDQRKRHTTAIKTGTLPMIEQDSTLVGLLIVERTPDTIYLARIELLPTQQGQGLGTAIIDDIIDEARQRSVPLTLDVLPANARAQRWYQRLGFRETARDSDDVGKIHMRLD